MRLIAIQDYKSFFYKKNSIIFILILISGIQYTNSLCQTYCQYLSYQRCSVCYTSCQSPESFSFNSCKQKQCLDINKGKNSLCLQQTQKQLTQQECNSICCKFDQNSNFTLNSINTCIKQNQMLQNKKQNIKNIVGITVIAFISCCIISLIIYNSKKIWKKIKKLYSKLFDKRNQKYQNEFKSSYLSYKQQKNITLKIIKAGNWKQKRNILHINKRKILQQSQLQSNIQKIQQQTNQNMQKTNQQICSICLLTENYRTFCEHSFHLKCIIHWIQRKQSCPLCITECYNPGWLTCKSCSNQQIQVPIFPLCSQQFLPNLQCSNCYLKRTSKNQNQTFVTLKTIEN